VRDHDLSRQGESYTGPFTFGGIERHEHLADHIRLNVKGVGFNSADAPAGRSTTNLQLINCDQTVDQSTARITF